MLRNIREEQRPLIWRLCQCRQYYCNNFIFNYNTRSFRSALLTFCPVLQSQAHHVTLHFLPMIMVMFQINLSNVSVRHPYYLLSCTTSQSTYSAQCSSNDKNGILFYTGYCHVAEYTSTNRSSHLSSSTILIHQGIILLLYFYVCY
jgi:hypothetical protein